MRFEVRYTVEIDVPRWLGEFGPTHLDPGDAIEVELWEYTQAIFAGPPWSRVTTELSALTVREARE